MQRWRSAENEKMTPSPPKRTPKNAIKGSKRNFSPFHPWWTREVCKGVKIEVITCARSILEVFWPTLGLLGPQNLKISIWGPKIGAPCYLGNFASRNFLSYIVYIYASWKKIKFKYFCFLDFNLPFFELRGPPWKILQSKNFFVEKKVVVLTYVNNFVKRQKILTCLVVFITAIQ